MPTLKPTPNETNKKTTRIFISYKTGPGSGLTYHATSLQRELINRGYPHVFLGENSMEGGEEWNKQLYDNVANSDLLIVLLARDTYNSHWVIREVDVARGAHVRILPVLIREDFDPEKDDPNAPKDCPPKERITRQALLDRFDFTRTQYVNLLTGSEAEWKKLQAEIERLEGKTLQEQMKWLDERREKTKGTPFKPANKSYATFKLREPQEITCEGDLAGGPQKEKRDKCRIHLAVGDITRMRGIDCIVNSENAYLQMARIFESRTVSALLRYYGSYIDEGGHLAEDTIQDELDAVVNAPSSKFTRPVGIGTVLVTSAGHESSVLRRKNKATYVFHTVTVSVKGDGVERTLEPALSDTSIWQAVYNTLEKTLEINKAVKAGGYEVPTLYDRKVPGQTAGSEANKRILTTPIKSIIIPLYASGHGGRNAGDVMDPLIEGVRDFVNDNYCKLDFELEHIHLCVYHREYVDLMRSKLLEDFDEDLEAKKAK